MSKRMLTIKVLALTTLLLSGCDAARWSDASSSIAIIDLLVMAKATGQDDAIRQQVEQATTDLNAQLAQIAKDLERQLNEEKAKLGDELNAEQQQQLQALQVQAQRQFSATQAQARQQAEQLRAQLVLVLKQQVQPIAERIAREKGAEVVLMTDVSTLWFDANVDITDEVIAALRAQPVAAPESALSAPAAVLDTADMAAPSAEPEQSADPAAK